MRKGGTFAWARRKQALAAWPAVVTIWALLTTSGAVYAANQTGSVIQHVAPVL